MNKRQLFKLGSGAGLATMVLGALMMLAPGVGAVAGPTIEDGPSGQNAAAECLVGFDQLGIAPPAAYSGAKWDGNPNYTDKPATSSYNGMLGTASATKGAGKVTVGYMVTMPAQFAVVKQSDNFKVAIDLDGLLTGSFDFTEDDDLSHFTLCSFVVTPSGSLSVDKDLAGNNQPAASTPFGFSVACTLANQPVALGQNASFTLTAAQQKVISNLPVGASCTVTETGTANATSTTYKIGTGDTTPGTQASGATIAANTTTPVLFTNTYTATQQPTGSLSVDKDLAGNKQPVATTQFSFTVSCTSGNQSVALGENSSFTLTAAQQKVISNLPVGASCTVTETGTANATSTTYKIGTGDTTPGTQASGATIAANTTTPVLFTNTYTQTGGDCSGNCGPPPLVTVDACPNLDGDQAAGTDCFPRVPTDVCPELPGVQQEVDNCPPEVGGEVVTNPPKPITTPDVKPVVKPEVKPTAQPAPAVLGAQTVRALPRTGDETRSLAGVGALMLALGAALVLGSKRQLARG